MRKITLGKHIGIAFLILGVSYTLFTLFHPAFLPHPEDFSPYPDFLAVVLLFAACITLRKQAHRWAYWGIFVVATLAFLDEIGYGTEIFGWPSLYLPQYHIEIHDLHNLIDLGVQLAQARLDVLHWNGAQFVNFLLLDAALLFLGAVFVWLLRFRNAAAKDAQWQLRILRLVAAFAAAFGLAASVYLFSLPADPKNAFLFGHSLARLGSAAFMLLVSFLPSVLLASKYAQAQKNISQWAKKSAFAWQLPALLFVLILLAVIYQFYMPFVFLPDQVARFERITPLVQWLLAELFVFWLALMAWNGHYRKPFVDLWRRFIAFNTREPAFFYAAFAVFLIFIAQLIDVDVIPLNDWIKTPNFHVQLWGLWTEEVFEMTSAYEFLAAFYFFPNTFKKFKASRNK
jgi:hypothetical protein